MFDVGFWELGLIAVVALLVIGPERLPAVARSVGFWLGKIRHFVSSVQSDFNREVIKTEELKELLEEQSKIKDLHEILEQSVDSVSKNVSVSANLFKDDQPAQGSTPTPEAKSIEPTPIEPTPIEPTPIEPTPENAGEKATTVEQQSTSTHHRPAGSAE